MFSSMASGMMRAMPQFNKQKQGLGYGQQMTDQQKPSLFGNMMSQMGQMKSTPNRFNPNWQNNWQSAINQGGQPGMMQGIFSRMNPSNSIMANPGMRPGGLFGQGMFPQLPKDYPSMMAKPGEEMEMHGDVGGFRKGSYEEMLQNMEKTNGPRDTWQRPNFGYGGMSMQNQMAGPSNDMRQRLLQYAQGTMMPGSGMMQPMRRMY